MKSFEDFLWYIYSLFNLYFIDLKKVKEGTISSKKLKNAYFEVKAKDAGEEFYHLVFPYNALTLLVNKSEKLRIRFVEMEDKLQIQAIRNVERNYIIKVDYPYDKYPFRINLENSNPVF